jgi:hypothetical protein
LPSNGHKFKQKKEEKNLGKASCKSLKDIKKRVNKVTLRLKSTVDIGARQVNINSSRVELNKLQYNPLES